MTIPEDGRERRVATFWADGCLFGVDVERVQEVLRDQEPTPVPLAPAGVIGLLNLRGQLVTAVDVRQVLGLAPRRRDANVVNFVIRTDTERVSLEVDREGGVVDLDDASFEAVPSTIDGRMRGLVTGAYKLEDALLLVLDADNTLARIAG